MRLSVLQENLSKGLSITSRAVSSRSTLPVLSNLLLSTDEERLKLSATNLELGISCWLGAQVMDNGAITLPARLLTDWVNSMPPDRIDMELNVRTMSVHLKCGRSESNIKGIDASEFPLIPTADGEQTVGLSPATLRKIIDQVVFAAADAKDTSRPALTGVLTRFEGDRLTLAATDGIVISGLGLGDEVPGPGRRLAQLRLFAQPFGHASPFQFLAEPGFTQAARRAIGLMA